MNAVWVASEATPVAQRVGRQLRAVVAAQERRRAAAPGDQRLQLADGLIGADQAPHVHGQRFAGVLVDDVDQAQRAAVGGHVVLEVDRPHLVRARGAQRRAVGLIGRPAALARPDSDTQALLAPQPLGALAIHAPAPLAQLVVGAAIAPPSSLGGDLAQRGAQRLIVAGDRRGPTLGGAMLTDIPTRPALTERQAVAQHRDRLTPAGRAHQFP